MGDRDRTPADEDGVERHHPLRAPRRAPATPGPGGRQGDESGDGGADAAPQDLLHPDRLAEIAPEMLVQLYRGQLSRADAWRQRLDKTTNWSVVLTATLLTWIFSSTEHPHYVLLVGIVAASFFLVVEARRYVQYDAWRYRTRMLEEHFFAAALDGAGDVDDPWRRRLAADLRQTRQKIPFLEALSRRLRRIHVWILSVLFAAWTLKVLVFAPESATALEAMAIERIPGGVVLAVISTYAALVYGFTWWPMERQAKGEIRDDGQRHKHD